MKLYLSTIFSEINFLALDWIVHCNGFSMQDCVINAQASYQSSVLGLKFLLSKSEILCKVTAVASNSHLF